MYHKIYRVFTVHHIKLLKLWPTKEQKTSQTSVAESRTVTRETRLRFARQVSRDSRKKSRNKKLVQKWPKLTNLLTKKTLKL